MSRKTDLRIIRSEQAIIEAGIGALLVNPSAGMSEIASAAGVGRATLYRHFESRDALVRRLALVCLEEIDTALKPHDHLDGRAAIEMIVEVIMPMVERFRFLLNLWSIVEHDEDVRRIDVRMRRQLHALFDRAKRAGDIARDLPTPWLVTVFDSTLTAGWTMVDGGDATPAEAAGYVKRSFFEGCGASRDA